MRRLRNRGAARGSLIDALTVQLDEVLAKVAQIRPQDIPALDVHLRQRSWSDPREVVGWAQIRLAEAPTLVQRSASPDLAAALLSMHTSGFVREAAVAELVSNADPNIALPFLLVRCADWVPEVRERAVTGVSDLLDAVAQPVLVDCLPLLERLIAPGSRGSVSVAPIRDEITRRVDEPTLVKSLTHADVRCRHAVARVIAQRGLALDTLDPALEQRDPFTALIVGRAVLGETTDARRRVHLEQLLASRFAPLAAAAAWSLLRESPAEQPFVEELLLDVRRSVRWVAQLEAPRHGITPVDLYRARIGSNPMSIVGLGECGTPDDARLVFRFTSDQDGRVRNIAVTALGRLDAHAYTDELVAALGDSSPSVARAASRALIPCGHDVRVSKGVISILTADDRTQHARRSARFLALRLPRWPQLRVALACVVVADDATRSFGIELTDRVLARWNTSFAAPTREERDLLAHQFQGSRTVLTGARRDELAVLLDAYGIESGR